ncbi:MAG: hypothetical protein ACREVV_13935 [Steroidobacteraceae bacterium]
MTRATSPVDPWHYPRPELAAKYLQVFDVGLTSARALFAKRRMGKSEFLEQDLIPAARDAGYLTVYLNLWDARSQPAPAFLAALSRALKPTGLGKLAKTLKRPLKSIKASAKVAGMAEGSLEAELGGIEAAATPRLTELIRSFDKPNRRMLLVLDEAQVLAESAHADLAHSLRASLDGRKQNIKVIFAGSSEATLRRMFGRSTEPFYNWAPLEPFELLGVEFVRAMVVKVNRLSRYPLSHKDALAAFEALKRTPEFFRRYLSRYLAYADLGSKAALLNTEAHVFNDANFVNTWHRLLPADRELLRLIVSGVTDLFSESSRGRLGAALGLDEVVAKNVPQQSLRRLQDADLVLRMDYGDYRVQDDALAEWLRNQELEG